MIYDKKIFQKLGNLLVETIPVWEEVTFHFDKRRNYSEWSAYYIQSSFDRESEKIMGDVHKIISYYQAVPLIGVK